MAKPIVLFVAYRMRRVEEDRLARLKPSFQASRVLKDPAKIAASVQEKEAQFNQQAAFMPYTGTFDEVCICDARTRRTLRWTYREPGGKKPPISVAVSQWLAKYFAGAWTSDVWARREEPKVVFVGFNPRLFLKVLGLECSLPGPHQPAPLSLWYGNSDHRDILEAVCPADYKLLDPLAVIHLRRPPGDSDDALKWDRQVGGWTGPGNDLYADLWLAAEMATQLGFIPRPPQAANPDGK